MRRPLFSYAIHPPKAPGSASLVSTDGVVGRDRGDVRLPRLRMPQKKYQGSRYPQVRIALLISDPYLRPYDVQSAPSSSTLGQVRGHKWRPARIKAPGWLAGWLRVPHEMRLETTDEKDDRSEIG